MASDRRGLAAHGVQPLRHHRRVAGRGLRAGADRGHRPAPGPRRGADRAPARGAGAERAALDALGKAARGVDLPTAIVTIHHVLGGPGAAYGERAAAIFAPPSSRSATRCGGGSRPGTGSRSARPRARTHPADQRSRPHRRALARAATRPDHRSSRPGPAPTGTTCSTDCCTDSASGTPADPLDAGTPSMKGPSLLMAELLFRIGHFAARRHWTVIGTWLALLAVTATTYVLFAGVLSSNISLPDTPTTQVSQQLEDDFEGGGGGNGAIVDRDRRRLRVHCEPAERARSTCSAGSSEVDEVADVSRSLHDPGPARRLRAAGRRRPGAAAGRQEPAHRRPRPRSTAGRAALADQRAQARAARDPRRCPRPDPTRHSSSSTTGRPRSTANRATIEDQAPQLELGSTITDLSSGYPHGVR